MNNYQNSALLSEERLAEIRDRAQRQVEAELAGTAARQQARFAKRQWIPLEEAWRRLFKINRDPEWIDSVMEEAAASGDVGFRRHPPGGRPSLLTEKLRGQKLQVVGNHIELWNDKLRCFSVLDPWCYRAVETQWSELEEYARNLLPAEMEGEDGEPGDAASTKAQARRHGPAAGTVRRYEAADRKLFPVIKRLTQDGKVSVSAAALQLARGEISGKEVGGAGTPASRAKRLAALYLNKTSLDPKPR
jgi:hypothetical protein